MLYMLNVSFKNREKAGFRRINVQITPSTFNKSYLTGHQGSRALQIKLTMKQKQNHYVDGDS